MQTFYRQITKTTDFNKAVFFGFLSALMLSISHLALAAKGLPAADAPGWELHKEAGTIKIYISEVEGADFDAFKATAVLNAPIENLMAVMVTPESCMEWVENCKSAYGLDKESFYKRYGYTSSHLPWPFKDRDLVVEILTTNDPNTGTITITMNAANDKVKENDDNVRIHIAESIYTFTKVDKNHTRVTWIQHTDPTGSLPSWLVNALIVDIPLKSLQKIEQVANWEKYQGYQLVYNAQGKLLDVVKK